MRNTSTASAAAATSTIAATTKTTNDERKRRYNQAAINAICSFMVVLLAAQSLKSGSERRKAELHLTAALEVLAETQDKLKHLTNAGHVKAMAAACVAEIAVLQHQEEERRKQSKTGGWLSRTSSGSELSAQELQQLQQEQIAAVLQRHLSSFVGDSALTEAEKDQKHVLELVQTPEDSLLQALQEEQETTIVRDADGTTVIKKRVFSI